MLDVNQTAANTADSSLTTLESVQCPDCGEVFVLSSPSSEDCPNGPHGTPQPAS